MMRLLISILVLFILAHLSTQQQALNCYVPADIIFLIDGSDSIKPSDWEKILSFVQNLIYQFDVADDAIHVGMTVYSSKVGDHIALKPFKDKRLLGLFAKNLRQPKASTNTGKGIKYAVEQFNSDGRRGVPKILIVITDGSSDNPRDTSQQANIAKYQGIKILAVGIGGQQFRDELRKIASRREKVYVSTDFNTLNDLTQRIRSMVCQVITTTPPLITTQPMPTLPPIPVDPSKMCNVPGDIIFLLDGSNSIADQDFAKLKAFVNNMIDNFEISADAIHIGLIVYSTVIGDTVGLRPAKNKQLLKILTPNLRHPKDGTNTARGIQRARTMFQQEGRSFAPKLLVVITDGKSTIPKNTIQQAQIAKSEGITIIAVGVGNAIFSRELNEIATSRRKVFEVSDFRSLRLIVNTMRDLICTAITTTPQITTPMTPDPIIPTVPPPPGLICNVPADVGFVLDGSDSVADEDWIRVKNFVANLINNLEIGRDTIHAGLVVYSTTIGEVVNLTPYKPKQLLMIMARQLKQPKVGTNTARGIAKMREMINAQGRQNAPKVMVIITDGRSTIPRETLREARYAKADGFTIITVGVGPQIFSEELRQIATNERKQFEVSDFRDLTRIIVAIRNLICQAIETTVPPPITTPAPSKLLPFPGCNVPAEIVIVMHGSENINEDNWVQNKRFVSNLINNLEVGNQAHHVGLVVYHTSVGDTLGLRPYHGSAELQSFANKLVHPGAGANTAKGIEKLREIFRTQARANVPHIGLVITDQQSTSPDMTKIQADLAKTEGIKLLTLGVGQNANLGELRNMASDGRKSFRSAGFNYLQNVLQPVRNMICEVITGEVKVEYNYTELCSGCLFEKGQGYNPFPGDCSRYVKCWVDNNNKVMGAILNCPFGQFWDARALACRPSMNVWCPNDPCNYAPNGFTYSMKQHGCRSYWVCINQASIGSCCPAGTYYLQGMGCMRGLACDTPCPPGGGLIVSPYCNKEEHWDQRYYIETIPEMGKVVRPCSPGTRYSKNYCMCVISRGLLPNFPGDQCRAEAYYPFDFDLKDKSGKRTSTDVINVQKTGYGTAHFRGNGRLGLWNYPGVDWDDKLVLRFKFKFDRWGNRYDYGGLIVDMGNGVHWVYDTETGWTRNATVGGGWNIRKLLRLFQRLYSAQSEAELERIMIQIANSNDFRELLYQIGFIPESSNAMQILRILVSGEGALLLRQILQQMGSVGGSQDVRLLLQRLLTMHEMEKWIMAHGGSGNNTQITMRNWRRFLSTLNVTGGNQLGQGGFKEFNIDTIDWNNDGRVIAHLWRQFIKQMKPSNKDRQTIYRWTFGNSGTLTGNFDRNGLIAEMRRVLTNNKRLLNLWLTFLRNNNIDAASFVRNGGWSVDTNTGYEWLKLLGGGTGSIGGKNIADMWRTFVTEIGPSQNEQQNIYTWSFGPGSTGGNVDVNGLAREMERALNTNDVRSRWLYFLHRNNIDTSLLRGLSGWSGGTDLGYAWLNWLGGGTGTVGGQNIADLWRSFVMQLNINDADKARIYKWTYGGGSRDINGLMEEMRQALSNDYARSLWLVYLRSNNIDVSTLQGNSNWGNGYHLTYEMLNWLGGGTGTIGGYSIADLWRNFVLQMNVGPNERINIYTWTYGNGGAADINGLKLEMQKALASSYVRAMWLYYLQTNNIDISSLRVDGGSGDRLGFEWLYYLGGGTGNIGGKSIADLWRNFVLQLQLTDYDKANTFTWTFGSGSTGGAYDINGLIFEMNTALSNNNIRQLWQKYLLANNINVDQSNTNSGVGWLNILRGMINNRGTITNLGYEWLNWLGGGTGTVSGKSIADLWKQFVLQMDTTANDRQHIYTWTFGTGSGTGGNTLDVDGLMQEMRRALANSRVSSMWTIFLRNNNVDVSSLQGNGGWAGGYNLGYNSLNELGGGTGSVGGQSITDLWLHFVSQLNVGNTDRNNIYKWTFGRGSGNVNGLMQEMRRALANNKVHSLWVVFLQNNNIDASSLQGSGGMTSGYNLGYETLNQLGGGTGRIGGQTIADLWFSFVSQLNVGAAERNSIYTWTFGRGRGTTGGTVDVNGLIQEMRRALAISNIHSLWAVFLQNNNIDVSSFQGSGGMTSGYNLDYETLNQLGGGTGRIGGQTIADLWFSFVSQLNVGAGERNSIYTWTFGRGRGTTGGTVDVNGLIQEMRRALAINNIHSLWAVYLQNNNIDISLIQGNGGIASGYYLGYETLNQLGGGSGRLGGHSIAELWLNFVLQLNVGTADKSNIYTWTYGNENSGAGGTSDITGLVMEMRRALANSFIKFMWLSYLRVNKIDVSALLVYGGIDGGLDFATLYLLGGGTGNIGGRSIAELWNTFVQQMNINDRFKDSTGWPFGTSGDGGKVGSATDITGLIHDMQKALTNNNIKHLWKQFLLSNNINIFSQKDSKTNIGDGLLSILSSLNTHGQSGNVDFNTLIHLVLGNNGVGLNQDGAQFNLQNDILTETDWLGGTGSGDGLFRPPMIHFPYGTGEGVFIHGLLNRFGGDSSGGSSGSKETVLTGGGLNAELQHILNNLQGMSLSGAHSSSSSQGSREYGYGGYGGTSQSGGIGGGFILDDDLFGLDLFRKKRDTSNVKERSKRQVDNTFMYQTLVSDCSGQGQRPAINIGANERSVKLHLQTVTNQNPAELELPVVPGWNEVQLVYDGRNMHGTVQNWRGRQHQKIPLTGKIRRSPSGISVGGCPSTAGFKGQIDDLIIYKCVPEALRRTFGMK